MKYKVGDEVLVKAKIAKFDLNRMMYLCELQEKDCFIRFYCPKDFIADKTYADGLKDAWELAKKILNMKLDVAVEVFDCTRIFDVMDKFTPQEALAKIEAYEEEKSEIKVGDVVKYGVYTCVVTVAYTETAEVLFGDGTFGTIVKEKAEKTGKHIDIESLLKQIGE